MKTRLSAVAGFLTAATLLSGSAFAFAPEFTGDIPTVIITDRITDSVATDLFDAPNGAAGIAGRESSAFLFRFDNAIDAASIVDVQDAGSLANVKVVFTEYTDTSDVDPNTVKTLSINGKVAVDDVPVDTADFDSSVAFDLSDPLLDFRNIDFSPGTGLGPFTNIGQVTGDNILATYPQSRVVTMHLGSDNFTDRGNSSDTSFMVVTTLEDNDRVTVPTLTEPDTLIEYGGIYGSNFDGYQIFAASNVAKINDGVYDGSEDYDSGNINNMVVDPTVTLVEDSFVAMPTSAGDFTFNTAGSGVGAQTGILRAEVGPTVALETEKLYRYRMNAQVDASAQYGDVYLQFGSEYSAGAATAGYTDKYNYYASSTLEVAGLGTTASDIDTYLLPKSDMIADYNTMYVQAVDYNSNAGLGMTVNGIQISVYQNGLDDFGAGEVLANLGGTVDLAAGEPEAPADDLVAFAVGTTPGTSLGAPSTGDNTSVTNTASVTASGVDFSMATSSAATPSIWIDFQQFLTYADVGLTDGKLDLDLLDSGYVLDKDQLYVLTVYAHVDNPQTATPSLIPFVLNDYTGIAGAKYFTGKTDDTTTGPTAPDPNTQLATQDKAYSTVFTVQGKNDQAKTMIGVQLYAVTGAQLAGSTITVTRMVLTEYDM